MPLDSSFHTLTSLDRSEAGIIKMNLAVAYGPRSGQPSSSDQPESDTSSREPQVMSMLSGFAKDYLSDWGLYPGMAQERDILQVQNAALKQEIGGLNNEVAKLWQDNETLTRHVKGLAQDRDALKFRLDLQTQTPDSLHALCLQYKNESEDLKAKHAFLVHNIERLINDGLRLGYLVKSSHNNDPSSLNVHFQRPQIHPVASQSRPFNPGGPLPPPSLVPVQRQSLPAANPERISMDSSHSGSPVASLINSPSSSRSQISTHKSLQNHASPLQKQHSQNDIASQPGSQAFLSTEAQHRSLPHLQPNTHLVQHPLSHSQTFSAYPYPSRHQSQPRSASLPHPLSQVQHPLHNLLENQGPRPIVQSSLSVPTVPPQVISIQAPSAANPNLDSVQNLNFSSAPIHLHPTPPTIRAAPSPPIREEVRLVGKPTIPGPGPPTPPQSDKSLSPEQEHDLRLPTPLASRPEPLKRPVTDAEDTGSIKRIRLDKQVEQPRLVDSPKAMVSEDSVIFAHPSRDTASPMHLDHDLQLPSHSSKSFGRQVIDLISPTDPLVQPAVLVPSDNVGLTQGLEPRDQVKAKVVVPNSNEEDLPLASPEKHSSSVSKEDEAEESEEEEGEEGEGDESDGDLDPETNGKTEQWSVQFLLKHTKIQSICMLCRAKVEKYPGKYEDTVFDRDVPLLVLVDHFSKVHPIAWCKLRGLPPPEDAPLDSASATIKQAMDAGMAFSGYEEGPLLFKPTTRSTCATSWLEVDIAWKEDHCGRPIRYGPSSKFVGAEKAERFNQAHAVRESQLRQPTPTSTSTSILSSSGASESGPEPPYARPNPKSYNIYHDFSPLELTYASSLPSFDIAYETWGWWEKFIGPGRALDTDQFFIICTNVLGGCYGSTGPSSLDPATGTFYATNFPIVTIFDMVRAQFRLLDHLGVGKLYASVGSSMGGMQSLAAGWLHPERVGKIISISGTARSSPSAIAMRYAQRSVLMADPNWNSGFYYEGLPPHTGMKLARQIATITYRSGPEWDLRFGRQMRALPEQPTDRPRPPALCPDFLIETYLDHQGEQFCLKYDANSLIYISKAMDLFDLTASSLSTNHLSSLSPSSSNATLLSSSVHKTSHSKSHPPPANPPPHLSDLAEGMQPLSSIPTLVLGVQSDILFTVEQQREIADALRMAGNEQVSYYELGGVWGHDTFLLDVLNVGGAIRGFLS
ncbi:hypothetical protein D9757_001323 [Collybiopsis confluens]|uniref:AB hydrolase-1 domain-containing protein n=1 Tax=Collybiopsis confluens TaxID=2823264 RepID=A0A8H5I138_9AGAR|nr:hypothetical protein D9757_001323 [Collybiopsis confluens]